MTSLRTALWTLWVLSAAGLGIVGCGEDESPPAGPGPIVQGPDTVPPCSVTDLRVRVPTTETLSLVWTSPGDDGTTGTATRYDIRLADATITDDTWNQAAPLDSEMIQSPKPGGQIETIVVKGLESGTRYYFALKTIDDADNVSDISNCPSNMTLNEVIPPASVTDLVATAVDDTSFELTWTAPGDDYKTGTASVYEIRFSGLPILDKSGWDAAASVNESPDPSPAGQLETCVVTGPPQQTSVFFALKTADELENWSGLSNPAPGLAIGDLLWASPTHTDIGEIMYITFRASESVYTRVGLAHWTAPAYCGEGMDLFWETVPGGVYTIMWDFFDDDTGQYLDPNTYRLWLCWGPVMKEYFWVLWNF